MKMLKTEHIEIVHDSVLKSQPTHITNIVFCLKFATIYQSPPPGMTWRQLSLNRKKMMKRISSNSCSPINSDEYVR